MFFMAVPPLTEILASEETCVNILRKACFNDGFLRPYRLSEKVIMWQLLQDLPQSDKIAPGIFFINLEGKPIGLPKFSSATG